MTDQRDQAIEAAAKALWDGEKHRSPWLSEAVTEVERRFRRIRAREVIAAYEQALGESYDDLKAERDELAKRLVAERDAHLQAEQALGGELATLQSITHGRHCACSSCAAEDWTDPRLAPCGMHGRGCPARYEALGNAGDMAARR